MFYQNNLSNRKLNFYEISNVLFSFIPLPTVNNNSYSPGTQEIRSVEISDISSVQNHSLWSLITSLYSGKESIYQSVASSQSRYISDDQSDKTRI